MVRRALLVAVAALVVPGGAAAVDADPARFRLDWTEKARVGAKVVMTYRVKQILFQYTAWSAEVEFANLSKKTIRIRPQFALLLSRTKSQDANYEALLARRSKPPLPRLLFPGQRWRGIISGPGRARRGAWVRVNFGFFATDLFRDQPKGFSWITDNAFEVGDRI